MCFSPNSTIGSRIVLGLIAIVGGKGSISPAREICKYSKPSIKKVLSVSGSNSGVLINRTAGLRLIESFIGLPVGIGEDRGLDK